MKDVSNSHTVTVTRGIESGGGVGKYFSSEDFKKIDLLDSLGISFTHVMYFDILLYLGPDPFSIPDSTLSNSCPFFNSPQRIISVAQILLCVGSFTGAGLTDQGPHP